MSAVDLGVDQDVRYGLLFRHDPGLGEAVAQEEGATGAADAR